ARSTCRADERAQLAQHSDARLRIGKPAPNWGFQRTTNAPVLRYSGVNRRSEQLDELGLRLRGRQHFGPCVDDAHESVGAGQQRVAKGAGDDAREKSAVGIGGYDVLKACLELVAKRVDVVADRRRVVHRTAPNARREGYGAGPRLQLPTSR